MVQQQQRGQQRQDSSKRFGAQGMAGRRPDGQPQHHMHQQQQMPARSGSVDGKQSQSQQQQQRPMRAQSSPSNGGTGVQAINNPAAPPAAGAASAPAGAPAAAYAKGKKEDKGAALPSSPSSGPQQARAAKPNAKKAAAPQGVKKPVTPKTPTFAPQDFPSLPMGKLALDDNSKVRFAMACVGASLGCGSLVRTNNCTLVRKHGHAPVLVSIRLSSL